MLELVGEIHGVQSTSELRSVLLPALRQIAPADYSAYNEMFADGRAPVLWAL